LNFKLPRACRIHVFEPLPLLVKAISLNLATHGCVVFHAHDGKTLLNDVSWLENLSKIPFIRFFNSLISLAWNVLALLPY
jgi:hypothetical protein